LLLAGIYSGGKDSTYALMKAMESGHTVACLVNVRSRNPWSYMFHTVNVEWVRLQAEAMGLPLLTKESPGEKERELDDLESLLALAKRRFGIEGVVSGAIASLYQKSRIDRICRGLELASIAPLWGVDPHQLLHSYLERGIVAIITQVSSLGISEKWLGRILDHQALLELEELSRRYRLHPCGEGGEYETFVLWAPIFKKRLVIERARKVWGGDWGAYIIEAARLE
jgi:ABC transporter with metal-binding/Fe-S-binding domain ATP-binding protein